MFKKTLYTVIMTSIFASSAAMAGDNSAENRTNHPATEMEESHDPRAAKEMEKHAVKYEKDLTENETNHPATEMEGSHDPRAAKEMDKHADKYIKEQNREGAKHPSTQTEGSVGSRAAEEMDKHADKYKENVQKRERLKDAETSQHPAHEMGESDELEARGN